MSPHRHATTPLAELWAARPWQPRVSACLLAFEGSEQQGVTLLTSGDTALAVSMWTDVAVSWMAFDEDYRLPARALQLLARQGVRLSTLDVSAWTDEERVERRLLATALRLCGWRDGVSGERAPDRPGRPAISGGAVAAPAPAQGLLGQLQRSLSMAYQLGYTAGCAARLFATASLQHTAAPKPARQALRTELRWMQQQHRWLQRSADTPPLHASLQRHMRTLLRYRVRQVRPLLTPRETTASPRCEDLISPRRAPGVEAPSLSLQQLDGPLTRLSHPKTRRLSGQAARAIWRYVRTTSPDWAARALALRLALRLGGDSSLEVLLREVNQPVFWEDDPSPQDSRSPHPPTGLLVRLLTIAEIRRRFSQIAAGLAPLPPEVRAQALRTAATRTPLLATLVQPWVASHGEVGAPQPPVDADADSSRPAVL